MSYLWSQEWVTADVNRRHQKKEERQTQWRAASCGRDGFPGPVPDSGGAGVDVTLSLQTLSAPLMSLCLRCKLVTQPYSSLTPEQQIHRAAPAAADMMEIRFMSITH